MPIAFTNWTGAFAGASFEDDPNGLVAWSLPPGPTVASFFVVPGAELAQIVWQTTASANVTAYQLRRASNATGPFAIFEQQGFRVVNDFAPYPVLRLEL